MPINQPGELFAIEATIGPRGSTACNSNNRAQFRRWITAKGWGADFAAILSVRELTIAYNNPGKGGGEPGKDAWLDKRLREFRNRQGEAQGEIDLGAAIKPGHGAEAIMEALAQDLGGAGDGPVNPRLMEELQAAAKRDADAQNALDLDDVLGIEANHDAQGEARDARGNPNYMGDAEAQAAEALDRDDVLGIEAKHDAQGQAMQKDLNAQWQERAQADKRKEVADKADQLAQMIRALVADKPKDADGEAIKEIVDRAVKKALEEMQYQPRVIEIQKDGELVKRLEGKMPAWFPRVLKLLQRGQNVLLVGPAGCGKTYVAEKLAEALDAEFGAIHGSAGASESQLTGWFLPVGKEGTFEYVPSRFVTLYERGNSLFLFDELDGFDPNMLLVVNGALANGHLHIAHRVNDPCVTRGENCRIIATANTFGTGANPIYAGRAPLDGSTLDRFITVEVDYDVELERSMAQDLGLEQHEAEALWTLRTKVREQSLRRIISTRAFQKAGAMKACGDDWGLVMNTLTAGWTRDERAKVGV